MSKEKQIEETYELIMGAFLTLLKEKSFNEITLTEIANNAGVARMTLYRHFKTKEQILIYRADMKVKQFKSYTEQTSPSTEDLINNFFIFFKELPLSQLITTDIYINAIFKPYILELRDVFYLQLKNLYSDNFDDYAFLFLIGGFNELLNNWCKNNFKEDTMFLTEKIMVYINILK